MPSKVNVNGGAISLGCPLEASCARSLPAFLNKEEKTWLLPGLVEEKEWQPSLKVM